MGCYVDSIADGVLAGGVCLVGHRLMVLVGGLCLVGYRVMVLAGGVCLVGHQPGTILGKEFQNLPARQEKH